MGELFGPYRLESLLGRGGMGEVWRAVDTRRNRVVALKRLGVEPSGEFEARFRRECELTARLTEPHVIPIHDYGEIDGRLYLDMRLVEGEDLKARLARGPLEPRTAARMVAQLAAALDAAHAAGMVHRDVKPANALITTGDFVYLADFGIVKSMAADTSLTSTNGVIGTTGYLAPERITGVGEDHRSDVYALACVLYECLTASRPFEGATAAAVLAAHVHTPPPRPGDVDPRLRPFDAVIAAGMAKDPAARPPSAGELARWAEAVAAGGFVPVGPALGIGPARSDGVGGPGTSGWAGGGPSDAPPTQIGAIPRPAAPPPPRRWPWVTATAAVLVVAVVVALVVVQPWRRGAGPVPIPVITASTTGAPTTAAPAGPGLAVLGRVPLGGDPRSLVVDGRGVHVVVVPKRFTDQVVTVDPGTRAPVGAPIDVSEAGGGIATDGATLWVPRCVPGGGACSLDSIVGGVVARGGGLARVPTNVVVEAHTGLAHVVDLQGTGPTAILTVDTLSGLTIGGPLPVGTANGTLALSPDGDTLALTDGTDHLTLVATRSTTLIGTVPTGAGSGYAVISPDNQRAYVSAAVAGTVSMVDLASRSLAAPPRTLDSGLSGVALSRDGTAVYVANRTAGTLTTLDAATLAPRGEPLRVGGAPTAVAVDGDRVYLLDEIDRSLVIVG